MFYFFSSRRRHTSCLSDWSSDVCSSDLGAVPVPGGVVIALSRLNRVLDIDIPNRRVTVEPGVTNLEITRQVAPHGYYYAPRSEERRVGKESRTRGRSAG